MSAKHLDRNPKHTGNEHVWWYEEADGIIVVHEPEVKITVTKIPWAAIRAALRRRDKTP